MYKYGGPHWADRQFWRDTAGEEQLRLAHRLRNDMVELAHEAEHRARRKDLYAATYPKYVQELGLGYGTHTGVLDRFLTSQDQVWKARKSGKTGASLRFHPWDGSGVVRVQTQSNGRPLNVWSLSGTGQHRVLHLRIRKRHPLGPLTLDVPFKMDRPLPEDALVSWIEVKRERTAHNHKVKVCFTLTLPQVPSKPSGDAADVRMKWTSDGAGAVKVAEISTGSGELPPLPRDVAHLVTKGDWYEVWAHPRWRDMLDMYDKIRSGRDDELDYLRERVVPVLQSDEGLAEEVGFTAAQARKMGSRKYAILTSHWPVEHELHSLLVSWREADKRLWRQEAHGRRRVIDARNDAYRKIAAWLTDAVSRVVIHDVDVSALKEKDDNDPRASHSRRQIQFAAPAELKSAIENAAEQRGLRIKNV